MTILMTTVPAADAQQQKKQGATTGEPCRAACEADLRKRKLWDKLPYGTCRRQCGMPV